MFKKKLSTQPKYLIRPQFIVLSHVLLSNVTEIFEKEIIKDLANVYNRNSIDELFLKKKYLQPILQLLFTTFYSENLSHLYPYTTKKNLISKPLKTILESLQGQDLLHIEKDTNRVFLMPASIEERSRFRRISMMEVKTFFDFLLGYSRRHKLDLQSVCAPFEDPIYKLLLIYAVIASCNAQILNKIGLGTPALIKDEKKKEVLEHALLWCSRIPQLQNMDEFSIESFLRSFYACYKFLIDSYFPKSKFEI